jgi:hypothetical protein
MADFTKEELSESTDGRCINVGATGTAGTLIHTSQAGTGTDNYDEVYLYAVNTSEADVHLTLEWGADTDPDDLIVLPVSSKVGLALITPGLVLQNSLTVRAFATVEDVVNICGFVNRISA